MKSKKPTILIVLSLVILALVAAGCGSSDAPTKSSTPLAPAPKVGYPAPDFTVTDLDGRQVSLSNFQGKAVLLNIWSFCLPCKVEKPVLQSFYQQYQSRGVEVVAVNVGNPPGAVKDFIKDMNLTYPVLVNPDSSLVRLYQIRGEPTPFFIDREGIIRAIHPGALTQEAIVKNVQPLL